MNATAFFSNGFSPDFFLAALCDLQDLSSPIRD